MRNFICDHRKDDLSVVEEIQRITSLSMEVRSYIIELQKKLSSDEKYSGLQACLDDYKNSIKKKKNYKIIV